TDVDVAIAQIVARGVIDGPVGPATVGASPPRAGNHRGTPPTVYPDAITEEAAMEEKSPPSEERARAGMEADKTGSKARVEAPEAWMESAEPGTKAPEASV